MSKLSVQEGNIRTNIRACLNKREYIVLSVISISYCPYHGRGSSLQFTVTVSAALPIGFNKSAGNGFRILRVRNFKKHTCCAVVPDLGGSISDKCSAANFQHPYTVHIQNRKFGAVAVSTRQIASNGIKKKMRSQQANNRPSPSSGVIRNPSTNQSCSLLYPSDSHQPRSHPDTHYYMVVIVVNSLEDFNEIVSHFLTVV
jgi:hypothetical protein